MAKAIYTGKTRVIDLDLKAYFDNVKHHLLLKKVGQRIEDAKIMSLLKQILKASSKKGVPQGGVISPLLSNLYLNEVDRMLERAKEVTRNGNSIRAEYARFADDLVVLVEAHPKQDWLYHALERRLREEFTKLRIEINEEKSRKADLTKGESFGFLGFDFRRVRTLKGWWRPDYAPKLKKRTELMQKLKRIFKVARSMPLNWLIAEINPILRGWVNYFAVGFSSPCFSYIRQWVEKKVRRHLARVRQRLGFGWKRWSPRWLYEVLGLFNGYRLNRHGTPHPTVFPIP